MEDVKTATTPEPEENGAAGVTDQTPSKKDDQTVEQSTTEQTEVKTEETKTEATQTTESTEKKETKVPVTVQERLDRMYARLQKEKTARIKAERERDAVKVVQGDTFDEDTKPVVATEETVEAILDRKEKEKAFVKSERSVLERHPSALNEDGTFNMNDPFAKAYIDIGRSNPLLAAMENGPELAEAMVEKQLGIAYKKGRVDEARRTVDTEVNGFTATSTTAIPKTNQKVELSKEETTTAARMGLSPQQYLTNKKSNKVVQKKWD